METGPVVLVGVPPLRRFTGRRPSQKSMLSCSSIKGRRRRQGGPACAGGPGMIRAAGGGRLPGPSTEHQDRKQGVQKTLLNSAAQIP